jgi:hypothetical protein
MKRCFLFYSFLLLFTQSTLAQEIQFTTLEEITGLKKTISINVDKNSLYTPIIPGFTFTSMSIEFPDGTFPVASYIFAGNTEKIILEKDTHNQDLMNNSTLIIPQDAQTYLSLYSGSYSGKVFIKLLYAKPIKIPNSKKKVKIEACDRPESIDQSIWRDGLPPPSVAPTATNVKHIVLHHSAGSNTNTDYVNVVRNIYLFHTQNNGWDDIGYNFVVAPNGLIFDGREGYELGEDEIKGAHFCGKNGGTMGICLLGNYEDTTANDSAIEAISSLLVWKLNKENLSTHQTFSHPAGDPQAIDLGTIVGHRDGCNTACTGQFYYNRIAEIKNITQNKLDSCRINTSINFLKHQLTLDVGVDKLVNITNTLPDVAYSVLVFNLQGKSVINKQDIKENYSFLLSEKGIYIIRLYNEHGSIIYKIAL